MRTLRRYEDPELVTGTRDDTARGYRGVGWSLGSAVAAIVGVAYAVVGLIALVRAGVDETWYRPVVQVLDANHTALLGAIEVGGGVLLLLAGASRSRGLAALIGLAMVVAGVVAGTQTGDLARQLAIEDWWAWTVAGAGAVVALTALSSPTHRRVV
jgi:hypothetical protein